MAPRSSRPRQAAAASSTEPDGFVRFLDAVCTAVREIRIHPSGQARPLGLAEYLALREPSLATVGDEKEVVDPVVEKLLHALGYGEGDVSHERRLDEQEERAVPDFTVRVAEVFDTRPVFVAECKATSVRDFHARRLKRSDRDETPREQLRRYVLSGVVHGRTGWLCNGFVLEAWEFGGDGEVRLGRVDLKAVAAAAPSGPGVLPEGERRALRVLWDRFSRAAFAGIHALVEKTRQVPPLPPRWIERVNAALRERPGGEGIERVLIEYNEEVWKTRAVDVVGAPQALVHRLRDLIRVFSQDVRQQLEDALDRHAEYRRARDAEMSRPDLDNAWKHIASMRVHFDLTAEEFGALCLEPLSKWRDSPGNDGGRDLVAEIVGSLEPRLRPAADEAEERQTALVAVAPAAKKARNGSGREEARRRKIIQALREQLEEFCRGAVDRTLALLDLENDFRTAIPAHKGYRTWSDRVSSSVMVGAGEDKLRDEFALQTAYVYLIRLLLVRICEDKGLFRRKLSDGGLAFWQERVEQYLDYAAGRSYDYLTRMAYDCAQNIYVHFYGSSQPFDWYRMDDKVLLRALVELNEFNLARIDTDIIGAVYGQYLEEGKHEQGRYYTPRPLVAEMLDRAGWKGAGAAGRRLADLACGSGSFLVEAARRMIDSFRGPDGRVPASAAASALAEVQARIFGLDVNPFACYLAETNLLIQVLDLVQAAKEAGATVTVDRFHVYCTDSLLVNEGLAASPESAALLGAEQVVPELLKARAGPFAEGIDVLVGNPPYVRADEGAERWKAYRRLLEDQTWFTTAHLKWDLFVPFVEQYRRLLAERAEARCCLVVSNAIGTSPYAEKLRELLVRGAKLHDVLFTEGLELFEDADWLDPTVFTFSAGPPSGRRTVPRATSSERNEDGTLRIEELDRLVQAETGQERILNPRPEVKLNLAETVPLEELCYISVGMVLNSDEKQEAGAIIPVPASYDPGRFGEELVEDLGRKGKRIKHRPFRKEELLADARDDVHTRRFIDSGDVLRGGLGATRWIEYGPHTRCPDRVRRPTFPELYAVPKLMFGTFTGVAVDEGGPDGFLVTSDSLRLAVRWSQLSEVSNRAVDDARENLRSADRFEEGRSEHISDWYLCALALGEPLQKWLAANKRSMKEHVYPDDIRAIPIKLLPPKQQRPFIDLAKERHQIVTELAALERQGYRIKEPVEVPVRLLVERFWKEHPKTGKVNLLVAGARGLVEILPEWQERDLSRARAVDEEVRVGREVALRPGNAVKERARVAALLADFAAALPSVWAERASKDHLPDSEKGLLALAEALDAERDAVRRQSERVGEINKRLDEMAWELYRP